MSQFAVQVDRLSMRPGGVEAEKRSNRRFFDSRALRSEEQRAPLPFAKCGKDGTTGFVAGEGKTVKNDS
jgi:hypothetical protein